MKIGLLAAVLLIALVCVYFYDPLYKMKMSRIQEAYSQQARTIVENAASLMSEQPPDKDDPKAPPVPEPSSLPGKVVLFSDPRQRNYKVHPEFGRLPDDLRADTPEQLTVDLFVTEATQRIGEYVKPGSTAGLEARRVVWVVDLVDIKSKRYLGQKLLKWDPDQRIKSEFHNEATIDLEVVAAWLRSIKSY